MPEAPDIAVNSLLDPVTGEAAAFEGLVGCHGGLVRSGGLWEHRRDLPPARPRAYDAVRSRHG